MKLVSFIFDGQEMAGVLSPQQDGVYPFAAFGLPFHTMMDFIKSGGQDSLPKIEHDLKTLGTPTYPLEKISLLAPIPRPEKDIICLGVNYKEHAEESARFKGLKTNEQRSLPLYFSKRVNYATAPYQPFDGHLNLTEKLDYEVELALIIGRRAKEVTMENAFDYILGYTIFNDITARDIQSNYGQFFFGKSLDGFAPMGPWIVTENSFSRPPKLEISCYVNGEQRQKGNTEKLIFSIPYIISQLSGGMTLEPGTIIATGTPSGVGMGFDPPRFLTSGDKIVCRIEGIGELENTVS